MPLNNDFDALLSEIGFGRWQIPVILSTVLVANQLAVHMLGSTLLSGPLQFRCSPLNGTVLATSSSTYFNSECLSPSELHFEPAASLYQRVNASVQYFSVDSKPEITGIPSCPLIEYDTSIFTSTIISEWHLVCDQVSLQPLYQMVYNVGSIIGSITCGPLGDKLGRRRAVQIGSVVYAAAVLTMGFTPSYPVVLAMRCVVGIAAQCMIQPAWSLAMESTPTRLRSLVGMLLEPPVLLLRDLPRWHWLPHAEVALHHVHMLRADPCPPPAGLPNGRIRALVIAARKARRSYQGS
ncbi:solute carrier family 22 member 6-like isoform X2 [Penaeus japonicus]|uniref:solute carrier family 22 member 6-like isoform X2 n=1 Tax=Penaeus japonicus TaxID=27405 RepID=UPI001C714FBF|nr:solute carrier family 22 member 6-like isoform X2 [Penaeus japonicus]